MRKGGKKKKRIPEVGCVRGDRKVKMSKTGALARN